MTKIFVLKNYLHTNIDKKQMKGLFYWVLKRSKNDKIQENRRNSWF